MADKWIPVRDSLPEDGEWVQVQTQDGTVYPATYQGNKWIPVFRGGLVEHLMHGKVAYWLPHATGYPYVQCRCGSFYLQVEGNKECPVCASFGISEPKPEKKSRKSAKAVETPVEPAEIPFVEDEVASFPVDEEVIF